MGLLFVLIFWAIVFTILSVCLGLPGLTLAHLYKKRTNKKVKLVAWFFAPGVLLFSFAGLFFFENIAYGIATGSDTGIGDWQCVNINNKYQLTCMDAYGWRLDTDVNGKFFEKDAFNDVQELLEHDDTIAFTAEVTKNDSTYYLLTQLDAHEEKYATIDSASTTTILWDRYTKARGLDKDDIYTCNEYYFKYRKYFMIFFLIFNILLLGYLIRRFGKKFLLEEYKNHSIVIEKYL